MHRRKTFAWAARPVAVLVALALLAPPLLHNHAPGLEADRVAVGGACDADGEHLHGALRLPRSHCPACLAGPAPAALIAASGALPAIAIDSLFPTAPPKQHPTTAVRVAAARGPPALSSA